ncbi:MAG: hypothetical protein ACYDC2_10075, partial [Solirubrobacteraceae bacterium]
APGGRSRQRRALVLVLLAAVACAAIAYLGFGTGGAGRAQGGLACAPPPPPPVEQTGPTALGPLRAAVARVLPQRVGRLYEEGTVLPVDAWRDGDPSAPAVLRTAKRPAAYELRWWAPNNDDIVADVFTFSSTAGAARFLAEAASPRCRARGRTPAARIGPPQGRNVTWVNPDAVAEADVFIRRGVRVYRVADVPAGQGQRGAGQFDLSHALVTIDTLACLLPQAHCQRGGPEVVPA